MERVEHFTKRSLWSARRLDLRAEIIVKYLEEEGLSLTDEEDLALAEMLEASTKSVRQILQWLDKTLGRDDVPDSDPGNPDDS